MVSAVNAHVPLARDALAVAVILAEETVAVEAGDLVAAREVAQRENAGRVRTCGGQWPGTRFVKYS